MLIHSHSFSKPLYCAADELMHVTDEFGDFLEESAPVPDGVVSKSSNSTSRTLETVTGIDALFPPHVTVIVSSPGVTAEYFAPSILPERVAFAHVNALASACNFRCR